MRSVGGGDGVGFPDVHLGTASTVGSGTGVWIIGGRVPASNVGLVREVSIYASENKSDSAECCICLPHR